MYLANSYLKCHGTKIEIKRSLHELLGWFFVLNTRLAPLPFFKIARLIVWWRYKGASIYIGIDIIFIFLQKIFNSLNSIAENLINSLDYWEDDAYLQDLFVSNWFLFSTFSWGNTMKIQNIFWGFAPNPPALCPGPTGGLTSTLKAPADYSNCCAIAFKKNEKNRPANFSLFWPLKTHINGWWSNYTKNIVRSCSNWFFIDLFLFKIIW